MTVRFYSSIAQISALTAPITNANTSMTLTTVSGWPTSTPFTAVIDPDTPTAEIVNVSATAGTTYTIQRGIDGSSATAHAASAVVRHMATARDFADSRAHENASTSVHGVTGAIVGTTATQTLTNKTLTSPTINGGTFDNIAPLSAWTTFTPTLMTAGGNVGGTAAVVNAGRYIKVGRFVNVQIETRGSAGMTIPGGDASAIIWNVPAQLAPRNPADVLTVVNVGTWVSNFIFGLTFGWVTYTNGSTGFIARFPDNTSFSGDNLQAGTPISLNLHYETAT